MSRIRTRVVWANLRVRIRNLAMSQNSRARLWSSWCLRNINLFKSITLIFLFPKQYYQCLTIVCYIGLKAMYVMH